MTFVTDSEDGFGLTICPHCHRRLERGAWCTRCGPEVDDVAAGAVAPEAVAPTTKPLDDAARRRIAASGQSLKR